jgi:membrane protein DedA with SNARE-associated domain
MQSPDPNDSPAPESPAAPPDGSAGPDSPTDGDGDRPPRHLVRLHAWLEARFSERTRRRLGLVVGFGAAILGTLVILVIKPLGLDIIWAAWIGLFLANWIGNGGILVPIPGLRLVGWTMAAHQGAEGPTLLVGLVAGVAMALGQTSFYLTAAAGSDRLKGSGKKKERSGRLVEILQQVQATIERFMQDHGFPTIFTLSLVPSPFMTFASITAATMGMGFREFLAANFLGHIVLGLILALFGQWLLGV